MLVICTFFFFSSRRRHTRCSRDWSSDVCSSDLALKLCHSAFAKVSCRSDLGRRPTSYLFSTKRAPACHPERRRREGPALRKADPSPTLRRSFATRASARFAQDDRLARSRERRRGEEGRVPRFCAERVPTCNTRNSPAIIASGWHDLARSGVVLDRSAPSIDSSKPAVLSPDSYSL